jgi:hypothetical protein
MTMWRQPPRLSREGEAERHGDAAEILLKKACATFSADKKFRLRLALYFPFP